jgi:predicted ATPase
MFGLCGAQRVGKTTLAQTLEERYGVTFVKTGASATFKRLLKDPRIDYPFAERLSIQQAILSDAEQVYTEAPTDALTDRTPMDMLAYTLADVQRQTPDADAEVALERYASDCLAVTYRYFDHILLIQPGIPLEEVESKAPASRGHMRHINTLPLGLIWNDKHLENSAHILPRNITDLDERGGRLCCTLRWIRCAYKDLVEVGKHA